VEFCNSIISPQCKKEKVEERRLSQNCITEDFNCENEYFSLRNIFIPRWSLKSESDYLLHDAIMYWDQKRNEIIFLYTAAFSGRNQVVAVVRLLFTAGLSADLIEQKIKEKYGKPDIIYPGKREFYYGSVIPSKGNIARTCTSLYSGVIRDNKLWISKEGRLTRMESPVGLKGVDIRIRDLDRLNKSPHLKGQACGPMLSIKLNESRNQVKMRNVLLDSSRLLEKVAEQSAAIANQLIDNITKSDSTQLNF
jgi:hypothetical protein